MANYNGYFLPDNLQYIFIEPVSFYWVKKLFNASTNELQSIQLGFTELITKNLKKNELRFNFRSENLQLRGHKPFLRLLTRNKYFEFLSPWKCSWSINPDLKNSSFIDHPYENYVIECHTFDSSESMDSQIKLQTELFSQITKLLEKDVFADCKDCPDFLQSTVTRRLNNSKPET